MSGPGMPRRYLQHNQSVSLKARTGRALPCFHVGLEYQIVVATNEKSGMLGIPLSTNKSKGAHESPKRNERSQCREGRGFAPLILFEDLLFVSFGR